jgi:hypothetical protein
MISRVFGAFFGMLILHALDEGLFDEALLRGAMVPAPTPAARFKFLVVCTLVPELPIAAMLCALWIKRKDQR